MSNAIQTQGFVFSVMKTTSPGEYVPVGEVTNFNGLDGKAAEIDVTHLQSTAKEFLMGLLDNGNWSMDVNYLPTDAGQLLMRAARVARTIQTFKATFSDNSVITFTGFVLGSPVKGGVDAKVDSSFDIRVSGAVTFG